MEENYEKVIKNGKGMGSSDISKLLKEETSKYKGHLGNSSSHHEKENYKPDYTANECPSKDKDGNSLIPGVFGDSEPIGGG